MSPPPLPGPLPFPPGRHLVGVGQLLDHRADVGRGVAEGRRVDNASDVRPADDFVRAHVLQHPVRFLAESEGMIRCLEVFFALPFSLVLLLQVRLIT